jgi:hypothetical protein
MSKRLAGGLLRLTIVLLVISLEPIQASATNYRLCIGEYDEKCPVSHNVFAGCGAGADVVAANTCAKVQNGQKVSVPYRLIHEGSHSGNRCGYEWYTIECKD